jgi:hypothetical protein
MQRMALESMDLHPPLSWLIEYARPTAERAGGDALYA